MDDGQDKKKILFVDDDEKLRSFCSEVLMGAGYNVEVASSGTEAYGKLRESRFDLVITGMRIPGLDGMGLYLSTLKVYSHMKERFLFMTEDTCADFESQEVITRQNEKYIIKPFDIKELLKKVESLTGANLSAFFARYRDLSENRREERRLCWAEDCKVFEDGTSASRPFTQTTDISRHGMRIRYMGSPIKEDSTVRVILKHLDVRSTGRIVWSSALNGIEAASGLSLSEPIPATAISIVLRGRKAFIPPLVSRESE
ncbi:MAG: response regulator [Thermodesulfobacteriota bacterium]|nr:MAG: response regulator [Thermodesulfobacteriota bacterium]